MSQHDNARADHEHGDHEHEQGHEHEQDHEHGHGMWHRLGHLLTPHSHDSADKVDRQLESSAAGMRVVWWSFAMLLATALAQAAVVVWSGSVALLGDTLHNVADALTAVPLAIAFWLGRRAANRRYTYGYGRAEDLAGLVVVALIAASAALAAYAAVDRLLHPRQVTELGWVAGAALVGFAGNELVARYRITVGRRIGSAALVADGLHARTDGFTSLGVLLGAGGVWLGWPAADPVVGLAITVAILFVLRDAAREVLGRLMDAVDPTLVSRAQEVVAGTPGIEGVDALRLRWHGHQLRAEVEARVDGDLSLVRAHGIAHDVEHRLTHELPKLAEALVHVHPVTAGADDPHRRLDHHR